jgi:hypothetical protein
MRAANIRLSLPSDHVLEAVVGIKGDENIALLLKR